MLTWTVTKWEPDFTCTPWQPGLLGLSDGTGIQNNLKEQGMDWGRTILSPSTAGIMDLLDLWNEAEGHPGNVSTIRNILGLFWVDDNRTMIIENGSEKTKCPSGCKMVPSRKPLVEITDRSMYWNSTKQENFHSQGKEIKGRRIFNQISNTGSGPCCYNPAYVWSCLSEVKSSPMHSEYSWLHLRQIGCPLQERRGCKDVR